MYSHERISAARQRLERLIKHPSTRHGVGVTASHSERCHLSDPREERRRAVRQEAEEVALVDRVTQFSQFAQFALVFRMVGVGLWQVERQTVPV